jgi:hypothetical protein
VLVPCVKVKGFPPQAQTYWTPSIAEDNSMKVKIIGSRLFLIGSFLAVVVVSRLQTANAGQSGKYDSVELYMKYIYMMETKSDNIERQLRESIVRSGKRAARRLIYEGDGDGYAQLKAMKIPARLAEVWKGVTFVPQYAHGNDSILQALQIILPEYDDQVVVWIKNNYKSHSPFILMEAARRLSDKDIDQAVYWYVVGLWKIRDEVKKCSKVTSSDVWSYWKDYAFKYIAPKIQKLKEKERKEIYERNLGKVLENWEQLIPAESQSWVRCETRNPPIFQWVKLSYSQKSMANKQYVKLKTNQ